MKPSTKVAIATVTVGVAAAIAVKAVQRKRQQQREVQAKEGATEVAIAVEEMVNEGAPGTPVVPTA
jgi:type II secretory pathway pseudopilin PulG